MSRFTNAQEMSLAHQEHFGVPTTEEIANLTVGSYVKVCIENVDPEPGQFGGERLWTEITEIDGDEITATLDSFPVIVDLESGDTVNFKTHHIYEVFDEEEFKNSDTWKDLQDIARRTTEDS